MSQVYNPESAIMETIERLEMDARDLRRRVQHAKVESDRRVLGRQLRDIEEQILRLQKRLPH